MLVFSKQTANTRPPRIDRIALAEPVRCLSHKLRKRRSTSLEICVTCAALDLNRALQRSDFGFSTGVCLICHHAAPCATNRYCPPSNAQLQRGRLPRATQAWSHGILVHVICDLLEAVENEFADRFQRGEYSKTFRGDS